mmetsp:Transcript_23729/g.36648  ORF Transcript_23729/g.36648 Transcript_23729/m.36648 type:complete len:470 (-) Transcript_23729:264-1673(-)
MSDLNLPHLGDCDKGVPSHGEVNLDLVNVEKGETLTTGKNVEMMPIDVVDLKPSENIMTNPPDVPVTSFQYQAPTTPKTDVSFMTEEYSGNPSRVTHRYQPKVSHESHSSPVLVDEVSGRPTMEVSTRTVVRPEHVANIFRRSVTTAAVTPMEIRRVKEMHDRISEGVHFSFNYNCLLFVAAMVAGLGLVSNATATIIASMLLSPIMGPVVGMAYGVCISDWALAKRALRNELLSLLFCIFAGGIMACLTGWTDLSDDWPTPEMLSRATLQSLLVSIPVAFFSGLGVAISVLDEQTSSLVGVAISASLLPPAVNAGILWVSYFFLRADSDFIDIPPTQYPGNYPETSGDPALYMEDDTSEDAVIEYTIEQFRRAGGYSLAITIANILFIILSSHLMFRMKENIPMKNKREFWTDLKTARRIYQNRAFLSEHNVDDENGDSNNSNDYDISELATPPASPERSSPASNQDK